MNGRRSCREVAADRTGPPVSHLGFIGQEATRQRLGREAWRFPGGAVNVDGLAAGAADEVMVVVADPGLESSRMTRSFQTADEANPSQGGEEDVGAVPGHDAAACRDR